MAVLAREEQHGGLVFGGALQVVQDVVRSDIGEDFADAAQKQHVVVAAAQTLGDGGDQVVLNAQYVLQQLQQVVFVHFGFHAQDVVPQTGAIAAAFAGLQQRYAQVVEIDL